LSEITFVPIEPEEVAVALYEQHHKPLLRYLLSIGLQVQDGEEVIQETFLALHHHLEAGKPRDNLRGWLFRVAHNLGLRARMRRRIWSFLGDWHFAPQPDPEQLVLESQRQKRAANVIRALSQRDRACLALRAEGFRYREISEILGMSLGSVAASMARTLDKLQRAEDRHK
jgi:RNA polymerase sigma-70 factor (ECF subfamily)